MQFSQLVPHRHAGDVAAAQCHRAGANFMRNARAGYAAYAGPRYAHDAWYGR